MGTRVGHRQPNKSLSQDQATAVEDAQTARYELRAAEQSQGKKHRL
jgi:hypothetical protein